MALVWSQDLPFHPQSSWQRRWIHRSHNIITNSPALGLLCCFACRSPHLFMHKYPTEGAGGEAATETAATSTATAATSTAATSRKAATATAGNVQFNQFKSPGWVPRKWEFTWFFCRKSFYFRTIIWQYKCAVYIFYCSTRWG